MQRTHIKLVLRKNKKNKSGEVPIYLRITVGGDSVYSSTGYYIIPKMWDSKAQMVKEDHPMHEQINLDITHKKREALDKVIQDGINKRVVSAGLIKESLGGQQTNVVAFCEKLIRNLGEKRSAGTYQNWRRHMKVLKAFAGGEVHFEQITTEFLHGFEKYIKENTNKREGKDVGSYVAAIMRTIRMNFNEAIGNKIIHPDLYPFKRGTAKGYEIPEQSTGGKEHLSFSELDRWERFISETTVPHLKKTAIYFLFGCYTGLRVSDWYQFNFSQVHGHYISLRTTKTKAWVAIPVHSRLKRVLELMKQYKLDVNDSQLNLDVKEIAAQIKLKKHLTTHCARKTFAVTMCLEMGVSSETAAELMAVTLAVFIKSYSRVTPEKIRKETAVWDAL